MTAINDSASQAAEEGAAHYRAGEYRQAAEHFALAQRAHTDSDEPLNAAEMANNRAVALLQLDDYSAALDCLLDTPAVFEHAEDWHRAAQAHGNLASALEGLGRYEEARSSYRQAMALFKRVGDDEGRSHTAKSFSRMQLRQGETLEAVTTMEHGLAGQERASVKDRLLRWLLRLPSRFLTG